MRLNWFLPFRPADKADGDRPPGRLRRFLAWLGPTWLCSPVRRIVQTASLVAFAWLFAYVCWPYTAAPTRAWNDWLPSEVDAQTGRVVVSGERPEGDSIAPAPIERDMVLYVVDRSNLEPQQPVAFRVTSVGDGEVTMEPAKPLSARQLDALAVSFGPWSLHATEPGSWPSHYADDLQAKQQAAPAELFLALDPLVSLSTALAARSWIWSLSFAAVILAICLAVPRGFCGYVCPLGTLIDLFDWALGRRIVRFRVPADGWWVRLKYYVLLATLTASVFGVLISGFVAAIPVVTRGVAFLVTPLQTAAERGWHQVPPLGIGQFVSIGLLLTVFLLGFMRPRFWCKYVCPTGAIFSIVNFFRLSERKVESGCVECGRCAEICPFDAVSPDFATRTANCTFCQTCGGACLARATRFTARWDARGLKPTDEPPSGDTTRTPRRSFLAGLGSAAACLCGVASTVVAKVGGAPSGGAAEFLPVRPPGSVPERDFLRMCIRCGECFQACPNDVLRPLGLQQGIDGLWTPHVVADWSGCEPSCNNCGQVCPTGAIRALPLQEKRVARMGLAVVDKRACLPYAGREECQLCVDECATAGYRAIQFERAGTEMDESGNPIEDTGLLAPVVLADRCVGCGLCQTRCLAINAAEKGLLERTAIRVEAGKGKEDRLTSGSYVALREEEATQRRRRQQELLRKSGVEQGYLPDFLE